MWLKRKGIQVTFIFISQILFSMLGQYMCSQHITLHTPVLGAGVKVWGQGWDRGLQGQLLCPCAARSHSRRPQWTHHRAQPSPPATPVVNPLGERGRVRGWETTEGTSRSEKEEGEKVLCGREDVHTTDHGEPLSEQVVISWRTGALKGALIAARGKWGKKWSEGKLLCTDYKHPPAALGGQGVAWGVRNKGVKLSLGQETFFCITYPCFSLTKPILTATIFKSFSPGEVCFACNSNW